MSFITASHEAHKERRKKKEPDFLSSSFAVAGRNIVVKVLQQLFSSRFVLGAGLTFAFAIFCCFRFLYLNSERFADLKAKSSEDRRSERKKNLFLLSGRHFSCCVILMNAERSSSAGHGAYIKIGSRDCRTKPGSPSNLRLLRVFVLTKAYIT